MKTSQLATLLLFTLFASQASARDFYGLSQILKGKTRANDHTLLQATVLEANAKGGVIQVRMPDTAGTTFGDYEFRWTFENELTRLEPGRTYHFRMSGRQIGGTSRRNTNTAWMSSSNMGGVLVKNAGIQSLANVVEVESELANVIGFPIADNNDVYGTVRLVGEPTRDVTYFTFKFDFGSFPYAHNSKSCSFEVAYVFRKNHFVPKPVTPRPRTDRQVEFYEGPGNRVFRFERNGHQLHGRCVIDGLGSTNIHAELSSWTVVNNSGRTVEHHGYIGTFESRLADGTVIRGTTRIVPGTQPETLDVTSTFTKDGELVRAASQLVRTTR